MEIGKTTGQIIVWTAGIIFLMVALVPMVKAESVLLRLLVWEGYAPEALQQKFFKEMK